MSSACRSACIQLKLPIRYNFYLDEMITLRNRVTVAKLEERGKAPVLVPEQVLKAEVALIPAAN